MSIFSTEQSSRKGQIHPPRPLLPPGAKSSALSGRILLAAVVTAIVLVWVLPVEKIPATCFMRRTFGVDCATCGMTRSLHALLHGHVRQSWRYHPLLIVYLAGAALYYSVGWWRRRRGLGDISLMWKWTGAGAALVLLLGVWVFRLLAGTLP